mgnify:FL=1
MRTGRGETARFSGEGAAEFFDGFLHVVDGDVVGDEGLACLGEEDEFDGAVAEFFVLGDFFHDGLGVESLGEDGGEVHGPDDVHDGTYVRRRKAGFLNAEVQGGAHAEGDGFTVEDFTVGKGGFDTVADGVSEVEEGAYVPGFPFVFFDDAGFDGDVARDEVGQAFDGIQREADGDFRAYFAEFREHGGVPDGGVLDDFGHAFREGAGVHGDEGGGVDDNDGGLVECADEVFTFGDVDGCFASGGAIGLGDNGRGDLDEGDAAVVDGCDEAGKVSDDASAKGCDGTAAVMPGADEFRTEFPDAFQALGRLPGGNGVLADDEAGAFQGGLDAIGVVPGDAGFGDDGDFAGEAGTEGEFPDPVQVAVVDVDVVGAFSQG